MTDKEKGIKKSLIIRTWERCKSLGHGRGGGGDRAGYFGGRLTRKSLSWHSSNSMDEENRGNKRRVVPEGCFSVYVGPQRQKFVVKTEYANHPLFRMLLEEAEAEYGYSSGGPIELPCDVQVFYRVLVEMDSDDRITGKRHGCGLAKGYESAYRLLSPSRMIAINQF
ncbi:auxin-responsive protein SAUR71-like [Punica granatum]|uniref:Uncharacterized protein n=2 Tax=Punica granatum TaxID=22663 RepID=A0A218XXA5_PUNGR|nr:auxin-responsive protein SAUR71-like [Punica granatum]OWM89795.1 hypothetical protein CDL15_Pgr024543 [Punica granatum]PKI57841.1 hypothetical protein CRG98_021744 [Punica granatum]